MKRKQKPLSVVQVEEAFRTYVKRQGFNDDVAWLAFVRDLKAALRTRRTR